MIDQDPSDRISEAVWAWINSGYDSQSSDALLEAAKLPHETVIDLKSLLSHLYHSAQSHTDGRAILNRDDDEYLAPRVRLHPNPSRYLEARKLFDNYIRQRATNILSLALRE